MTRRKKHRVGDTWKAYRKVGKRRRKCLVTKKSGGRYGVKVMGSHAAGRRRDAKLYNKSERWERAYRRKKRRHRR